MKTDIRLLYFIIFYNFVDNKSINQIFLNCKELSNQLNIETISKKNISIKIMKQMHNEWTTNLMATEPCINGKSQVEIDESKVININNLTRWILGICDRGNYDIRIFYVNNNRTRDTLLPLIINNVYTYPTTIINNRDEDNIIFPATRVFSDYFSSYEESDFNSNGFILQKVNHSVWFGQGSFQTNSIEGVWSRLKRLTDSFNVLNSNIFNTSRDINIIEYFKGWNYVGLFYMRCEHLKLGLSAKKKEIIKFLKIN